jgi:hypothetical protein
VQSADNVLIAFMSKSHDRSEWQSQRQKLVVGILIKRRMRSEHANQDRNQKYPAQCAQEIHQDMAEEILPIQEGR